MATKQTRITLHENAGNVIELFDDYEGMGLISIRFGYHDGTGEISWSDETAMDQDMAKALSEALLSMAGK